MNHLEGRLIGVLNSEVRLIISPKSTYTIVDHHGIFSFFVYSAAAKYYRYTT